jgi:hypothetical protein
VTATDVPVLAVVVATRGGTRLESALASVAWARERAVLDPLGATTQAQLPPGVRVGHDAAALPELGSAAWILLTGEHEVASEALAIACATAVRGAPSARRVPVEVETLGIRFAPRVHPVRLAPREGSRLGLDRTLELELRSPSARGPQIEAVLRATGGESVAAAIDSLAPEGRALAALLGRLGQRPGALALGADPLAALVRMLRARASGSAGLARWVAAVFASYRVTLAHVMLWEWRRAQPAPVRVVG